MSHSINQRMTKVGRRVRDILIALAAIVCGALLALVVPPIQFGGAQAAPCQPAVGRQATADIPPGFLSAYKQAGERYHVPWPLLAGIGKVQSDHGRKLVADDEHVGPMGIRLDTVTDGVPVRPATGTGNEADGDENGLIDLHTPADSIATIAMRFKAHNSSGGAQANAPKPDPKAGELARQALEAAERYAPGFDLSAAMKACAA
ncbi:hypothetical protein Acsp03_58550 [Actinomadura sp. NBRC 104412]|uniref:hypothetical protein n=1 Tax=Actinomadura sp. NBRC 104412 TaxID=3032203 RepID=UPI00249FA091|nr:hypothetical protein [Actinomadura sp. NBRC 104412]GLZ08389.1 hypothetical protein Acsp03_58550 [Actinomadura sp. NBRC 104412]